MNACTFVRRLQHPPRYPNSFIGSIPEIPVLNKSRRLTCQNQTKQQRHEYFE